jgi:hypothetical protein
MELYERKGQMAGEAVSSIISLIVGVGVAVLVLIFVGSLGGQTYNLVQDDISQIANNVVTGDAFTFNSTVAQNLNHGFIQQNTLAIYNASAPYQVIGNGNFTIDYDAGTVLAKGLSGIENGTSLAANYTWGAADVRTSVQEGIISAFQGLEQTGDYLPIIVLAVVIALVLSLVLGFTAFGGRNIGGNAL